MVFQQWRKLVSFAKSKHKTSRPGRQYRHKAQLALQPFFEQLEERVVPTKLSIPAIFAVTPGAVVNVPIDVDSLYVNNGGSTYEGLSSATFVVFYNPAVFTVATADVNLGTLATNGSTAVGNGYSPAAPNGWGGNKLSASFSSNQAKSILAWQMTARGSSSTQLPAPWSPLISMSIPRQRPDRR